MLLVDVAQFLLQTFKFSFNLGLYIHLFQFSFLWGFLYSINPGDLLCQMSLILIKSFLLLGQTMLVDFKQACVLQNVVHFLIKFEELVLDLKVIDEQPIA